MTCISNKKHVIHVIRRSGIGRLIELVEPAPFGGLGGGIFQSKESIHLYVRLLEFWCRQWAYVVEDNTRGRL